MQKKLNNYYVYAMSMLLFSFCVEEYFMMFQHTLFLWLLLVK